MNSKQILHIYKCPNCDTLTKRPNPIDLFRDGTIYYSDFSVNISKNDVWARIAKCRECDTIFWLRKVNKVEQESIENESEIADIKDLKYLDLEDYFTVLSRGDFEDERDEVVVRRNIWWLYNDRIKVGKPLYTDKDDLIRWSDNLEHYLKLLENLEIGSKIVIAEINRNLGAFDNCIKIIEGIEDDEWPETRERLIEECKRKNSWVVEIKRTGPLKKKKYRVEIRELLSMVVELEAYSAKKAVEIVEKMYIDKEIVLDEEDLLVTEIDEYQE